MEDLWEFTHGYWFVIEHPVTLISLQLSEKLSVGTRKCSIVSQYVLTNGLKVIYEL